jgi:hypothetical protein
VKERIIDSCALRNDAGASARMGVSGDRAPAAMLGFPAKGELVRVGLDRVGGPECRKPWIFEGPESQPRVWRLFKASSPGVGREAQPFAKTCKCQQVLLASGRQSAAAGTQTSGGWD